MVHIVCILCSFVSSKHLCEGPPRHFHVSTYECNIHHRPDTWIWIWMVVVRVTECDERTDFLSCWYSLLPQNDVTAIIIYHRHSMRIYIIFCSCSSIPQERCEQQQQQQQKTSMEKCSFINGAHAIKHNAKLIAKQKQYSNDQPVTVITYIYASYFVCRKCVARVWCSRDNRFLVLATPTL